MWVERPDAAVIFYFLYCMGACIVGRAEKYFLLCAVSDTKETIFLRWLLDNKKNCAEKVDFIVMDL